MGFSSCPMFLIMYMLLIRPQQKRVREHKPFSAPSTSATRSSRPRNLWSLTAMDDETCGSRWPTASIPHGPWGGTPARSNRRHDRGTSRRARRGREAEPTHDEKN